MDGGYAGMSGKRKAEDRPVPLAELMRIEAICDRFEAAWRSDECPDLAAFMADGSGPGFMPGSAASRPADS